MYMSAPIRRSRSGAVVERIRSLTPLFRAGTRRSELRTFLDTRPGKCDAPGEMRYAASDAMTSLLWMPKHQPYEGTARRQVTALMPKAL
jgi:hypothetical protein